jgi:hypothetical protein
MKVYPTAVALIATLLPNQTLAQQCVLGGFSLEFDGRCTTESVVAAYADQVFDAPGATTSACASSAEDDLLLKVQAAGMTTIADLCDQVYATQDKVLFTDAANRGTDMHFEKMFYNGRTDWQEEVETKYETEDETSTSILKEDAEAVRVFFDGIAQGRRVEWPGSLTNFQSAVTDSDGLATCTTNAAMCCWPKDRQANDNNGNCAKPYDENCVNKDPADNTDLCYVDLERGNASTGFASTDTLVYPGDNNEGEGAIHCHGLAWSNDVNDHTARYKANNLFFVSMYDHMYQRGYVQNIPGAPMCGCVEQMPTVSRSDCTQVDLTETVEIKFDGASTFDAKLTQVHVDFNACQGVNNRNNDLWAYMARLYYQGDITREQFGEAGRIITDNGCQEATKFQLNNKGLTPGYDYDLDTWTNVAGREAMYKWEPFSHQAFANSLVPGNEANDPEVVGTHYGIIYRACQSCVRTHMKIFYRRRTPVPEDFNLIHNIINQGNDGSGQNVWGVDFSLHSTYDDALKDANPWECPNNSYNYGQTFYGECSPDGTRVRNQRARLDQSNDRQDVGFYINKAEDQGIQVIPTNIIDGRDWAAGRGATAQKDADGTIYLAATGRDIWWYRDDFNYLAEPVDGDHTVTVHVGSIKSLSYHDWAKTGIQFRTNLDSDSANYGVYLTGSNGVNTQGIVVQGRWKAGQHASHWYQGYQGATEAWLKVEKRIDTYTAFVGTQEVENGPITWTVIDSRELPEIGDSYYVGLGMSSARPNLAEAVFTGYEADSYFFPSAAPSVSSAPSVTTWNLALEEGAAATQSSTCYGGEASRAIDGGTAYEWGGGSVMHTCHEPNPWWMVTLDPASDHTIYKVIIHNRGDCCQNRLKNSEVQILDSSGGVVAFQPITTGSAEYAFDFDGVSGTSVRIYSNSDGQSMNVAEVQVLGQSAKKPSTSPTGSPSSSPTPQPSGDALSPTLRGRKY